MKNFIKFVFFLLFLASCGRTGASLDTGELKIEFEDIWWELSDVSYLELSDETVCLKFATDIKNEDMYDGVVIEHTEGDDYSYVFSNFVRIPQGYQIVKYNAEIFVFRDDEGYYIKVKYLCLSDIIDIIPCSLSQ